MNLLAFDTSTKVCAVAFYKEGNCAVSKQLISEDYIHSEKLIEIIQTVCDEAEVSIDQLDHYLVGLGPGSYTGLRIGASLVKGLAYPQASKVIGLTSTQILFEQTKAFNSDFNRIIPMIDARRNEVYLQHFDNTGNEIEALKAEEIENEWFHSFENERVLLVGDGAIKFENAIKDYPNIEIRSEIQISCDNLEAIIAEKIRQNDYLDLAYFEPTYVKSVKVGKAKQLFSS